MKKRFLIGIALMLLAAVGLFAQTPVQSWAKSYNRDGQIDLYASVGYWLGICVSATGEYVIGEWNIGGIPFDYGVQVMGIFENYSTDILTETFSVNYWGVAPMFAVHMGLSNAPFEFIVAAGLGFYGYMTDEPSLDDQGFGGIGFATSETAIWYFADNMGLLVQFAYVGATSIWGIGIRYGF
ncbi:MAG: hypothetical protein EHM28_03855 [Spirochaetaceae bacterium]|nr:MAG: hypothetical protein EHM28_03855 [Spirochaetaceae bacterium]